MHIYAGKFSYKMETRHLVFPFRPDAMMQPQHISAVHHLLCHQGTLTVDIYHSEYTIRPHDYAILHNVATLTDVRWTEDFTGDVMILSEELIRRLRPHNNYHVFGQLSLYQNPVMHLSEDDYATCCEDIRLIRRRIGKDSHLFYDEMLEHLMMTHVLNIYDIHARQLHPAELPERASQLLQQFIALLNEGHYRHNRTLQFYADRLCITPHYLSEISKKVTGEPATFWIDMYLGNELVRLITTTTRTLTDIADELHFSSLSYFTQYAQKVLGQTPSQIRQRIKSSKP